MIAPTLVPLVHPPPNVRPVCQGSDSTKQLAGWSVLLGLIYQRRINARDVMSSVWVVMVEPIHVWFVLMAIIRLGMNVLTDVLMEHFPLKIGIVSPASVIAWNVPQEIAVWTASIRHSFTMVIVLRNVPQDTMGPMGSAWLAHSPVKSVYLAQYIPALPVSKATIYSIKGA